MVSSFQKAVDLAGGKVALAKALGIDRTAIYSWREDAIPAERVIAVCEVVGWKVIPHELRPDLYPNPSDGIPSL